MNTKVNLNRLEHFIPSPENDGILYVNDNEEKMIFKPLGELNAKFGRDNITAGGDVEYNSSTNKFIISPIQTTVYKRIGYTYDNQGLHVHFPLWGLNGAYKFEEQDIGTVEEDDSTAEYTNPDMTSNTTPYGKCMVYGEGSGNIYDVFNSNTNEYTNGAYSSINGVSLVYMFDYNGEKEVKPLNVYIKNGSSGINATGYEFSIYGTRYKHPFDDGDWDLIKNITSTHPITANDAMTHNLSTNNFYRGIKFLIKSEDFSFKQIQINGITKDSFGTVAKNKYFLCHILRNGNEKNIVVSSYNDIPVFSSDTLVDFLPITTTEYYINDFDNQIYYETNTNSEYTPDLTQDGKVDVIITPDGIHSRKLFEYTVENGDVINYYPKNDLATSYVNRFIIAEQQGDMGYKIFSDGWKIQWGNQNNPTFPVAFENKPLVITPSTATNVTNIGMTCTGNWTVKGY